MAFFQNSVLNKHLKGQDAEMVKTAYQKFTIYFHNPAIQQNIRDAKEEQFQEGFLRELFVNILGYSLNPQPDYNLTTELKNEKGAKKADGAILQDGKALGVIELKGTNTKDLDKINEQAFNYKNNQSACVYVITSNFEKLRFFIHNAVEHIEFNLFTLSLDEFKILWLCLNADNLLSDVPLKVKEESLLAEENITKQLYKDYSAFKADLWQNMAKNHPQDDQLMLFKKTQKLLDRFLFIFFAEDSGLLPPNSISKIIEKWKQDTNWGEDRKLYDIYKQYFGFINSGRQARGDRAEIFGYNGGLFQEDLILDNIKIDDEILLKHTEKLTAYDFQSEVDVNILGHIFENSLNEIENITAELEGQEIDRSKTLPVRQAGKRKKDGVFYTPKYITKYIVNNTVGKLCEEKKAELNITDERFGQTGKRSRKGIADLQAYRDWLLDLKICDPACGSGAFLNQALDFLMKEHQYLDELTAQYHKAPLVLSDIESQILEQNIYGVDINEESVEIAKLSLWLRTAQRGRKLTSLNNNIKCGNSLIDDPKVAGAKAFNWQREFPNIFIKKEKKAWHVTWVTHDTRTSERMKKYKVRERRASGEMHIDHSITLENEDAIKVTEFISQIVIEYKLNCLAYNVCDDHVHMLLVCEEEELNNIVRKLKGKSAQKFKELSGIPKEESFHLWAQKYNKKPITSDEQLYATINYINTNREKHELPDINNEGLQPLVEKMTCDIPHAFRTEYKGGFDVVIGNPPYVRADSPGNLLPFREHMVSNGKFKTLKGKWDLYIPFVELSINLIKSKGYSSLIIPDAYCHADYSTKSLEVYTSNNFLERIDYYPNIEVFANVGVKSVIVSFVKDKENPNFISCIHKEDSTYIENISDNYPKSFRLDYSDSIIENVKNSVNINDILYLSKGIVGNSCEKKYKGEFKVGDLLSIEMDKNHIKLYYEGKNIKKWSLDSERWIEYNTERSPKKWSRKGFPEFFEAAKIVVMRSPGQIPRAFLDDKKGIFNESAIGFVRWCDLKGVNNKSISKSYKDGQERLHFELLSENLDLNYLVGVMNSKLIKYELNSDRRSNIHIYPDDWRKIKIMPVDMQQQKPIINSVNSIRQKTGDLNRCGNKFVTFLNVKFPFIEIVKKLQNWHELDFGEFIKELNKAIKKAGGEKLSKMDEMEWMDVFETKGLLNN